MPERLLGGLSDSQLIDALAYLRKLQRRQVDSVAQSKLKPRRLLQAFYKIISER